MHLVLAATITVVYTAGEGPSKCYHRTSLQEEMRQPIAAGTPKREQDIEDNAEIDEVEVKNPQPSAQTRIPWVMKLDWIIFSIISSGAIIVSIVYFSVLYPKINPGKPPKIQDIHVHGVNSLVIILELCFNAIPIRLAHAIYPLIYGMIYMSFSLVFWGLDNTRVIYPVVLDWNNLKTTLPSLLILACVIVPIVQLLLFYAYRLKMKLYHRLYPTL